VLVLSTALVCDWLCEEVISFSPIKQNASNANVPSKALFTVQQYIHIARKLRIAQFRQERIANYLTPLALSNLLHQPKVYRQQHLWQHVNNLNIYYVSQEIFRTSDVMYLMSPHIHKKEERNYKPYI
jgi:hypothetical protein